MGEVPEHWGRDEITRFLDIARANQLATFANNQDAFRRYLDIDVGFRKLISDGFHHSKLWFEGLFAARAHSAFLAAVKAVCSGQVVESYALNRVVIEQALYGFFLTRKPELRETWLKRHDDAESLRNVRRIFKISEMVEELRLVDANDADVFGELYERSIDYGAHPNERAFTQGLESRDVEDGVQLSMNYFFPLGPALDLAHKTTAQSGVCALSMYRPLMKERYDVLDLTGLLDHLKKGL